MEKEAADPLVGKIVAQYEILAKLGGGGMGIVYAARDTKLGRRVALKFLPPQWSHDESARQRFVREAQAASATDHRNICTIHDFASTDEGQLFIVMAHYEGQTLKQRLEAGPLPVDPAIDIAAQVAEGLAKAHARGVVHRDIKPGNLMLTEDGVRILDFGLAKFADARFKLTLEGSTLGTIAYMSPEQARGEEAGVSADIWATGVVLYEMLTGDVPFKGAYWEAISHAIRNDPPPPIRAPRYPGGRPGNPAVPETLEQLVFRALHKDPAVRFQTARELARALRLLQGRTLPLDLQTEPLPPGDAASVRARSRRRWTSRAGLGGAAALVSLLIGGPLWIFAPTDRVPVAVAPVVNQTGYAELDGYRMALTQELVAQLVESGSVQVLPYDRLLQIVRRFPLAGRDLSSREAMQAVTQHSGAEVIIVPTLLYENGGWKGRVEFRNARTATSDSASETAPVVSSLIKDTAYGLMTTMAAEVEEHFIATGPRRASVALAIRRLAGREATEAPRMRTLDAAAALAQGVDAYEQQEYAAALRSFTAAAEDDARNPLLWAWRSRAARIVRRDDEALDAAERAARLVTAEMTPRDRLFVEAVVAEARRDGPTATARHRELVTRFSRDPTWIAELAAFQDRQSLIADAAVTYLDALAADKRLVRPHLELCRLYGPNRLNESAKALEHGQLALAGYRALGARGGEAQALMCLADTLRTRAEQRDEARRHAETALKILEESRAEYQLARAHYYVALVAGAQGRLPDAVAFGERSLAAAKQAGNAVLEPLVLMNLGVANALLRNRPAAVDYYRQSSTLFDTLDDEVRAAQTQSNAGALLVEYGTNPDEGLRDLRNALSVFRKLGEKDFEVFCLQNIARYYRYAGRHTEAEAELNRGLAIARERNNDERIASLTIDLAASRFELGDYEAARTLLTQAIGDGSGRNSPRARIHLGHTHVRLGAFAQAKADLAQASLEQEKRRDPTIPPLLHNALGHLAYESGRLDEARARFGEAAGSSTDDQPDASVIEARAYLGWVDMLTGSAERGRAAVIASLDHAVARRRPSLEALCRLLLARIDIAQRRFPDALARLRAIPPDDPSRTIGAELRAQIHHWQAQALLGRGDHAGAASEQAIANKLLGDLRALLPAHYRAAFTSRREIRSLSE